MVYNYRQPCQRKLIKMVKEVIFYTQYDNDSVSTLHVKLYHDRNYAEVHQTADITITHNILKEMLIDFEDIKHFISCQGITRVYTGTLTPTHKMLKYWEVMGFTIVDEKCGYMEVI